MYVVGGGQEQLPLGAGPALLSVRSAASRSAPAVEWAADVDAVLPGTALREPVTRLLGAPRLNPPDRSDLVGRRVRESALLRFSPVGFRPP